MISFGVVRGLLIAAGLLLSTSGCGSNPSAAKKEAKKGAPISVVDAGDASSHERIVRGFLEYRGGWWWVARSFAVSLDNPEYDGSATYAQMEFVYPQELRSEFPSTNLSVVANGIMVCKQEVKAETRPIWVTCQIPQAALKKTPVLLELETDRSFRMSDTGREQGFLVLKVGLVPLESTEEFRKQQAQRALEAGDRVLAEYTKLVPPAKARELLTLFHKLPVWESLYFMGVQTLKNPLDLWMMQQAIHEVRPDFIIETGTYKGGSALYFASLLQNLELWDSRVITIDIGSFHQSASMTATWKLFVDFHQGSSTDPALVAKIAERVKGAKVFVTLDSDHRMAHVYNELKAYAPMVSKGSYLIVEDTHLDGLPTHPEQGPGPTAAVLRFMKDGGDKEFERDKRHETTLMSFNPGGWLRKK